MSKDLVSVSANESIEEAAKLMRKKGVRRLVVIEDDIIIGVITETDITKTFSERMDKKMFDVV